MSCCDSTLSGLAIEVSLKSPNTPFIMAVSGTGTTRTVSIDLDTAGYFLLRLWLIDDNTDPGEATLTPPTGDETVLWHDVTAADGTLTKTITHTGTGTWYLAVTLLGRVQISDAIAFT